MHQAYQKLKKVCIKPRVSNLTQPNIRSCEVKLVHMRVIVELKIGGPGKSLDGCTLAPTKPNLLRAYSGMCQ